MSLNGFSSFVKMHNLSKEKIGVLCRLYSAATMKKSPWVQEDDVRDKFYLSKGALNKIVGKPGTHYSSNVFSLNLSVNNMENDKALQFFLRFRVMKQEQGARQEIFLEHFIRGKLIHKTALEQLPYLYCVAYKSKFPSL